MNTTSPDALRSGVKSEGPGPRDGLHHTDTAVSFLLCWGKASGVYDGDGAVEVGATPVPSCWSAIRIDLLEQLEPGERDLIADLRRRFQFRRRLAPVEADPAAGADILRSLDEVGEIVGGAAQREHLLDDDQLAVVERLHDLERVIDLLARRVIVNAEEVEIARD